MTYSLQWLDEPPADFQRLYYFTGFAHLVENIREQRVKLSSFEKCNDVFELASFKLDGREARKRHRCWIKQLSKRVAFLCKSKNWRHPLMWAHYAERGSGACMVLDVCSTSAVEVEYTRARTNYSGNVFPKPGDLGFESFCSRKATVWRYEAERRVFKNICRNDECRDNDMYFLKLGKEVRLVGVINGPRPDLGADDIIKEGIQERNFFQTRPAFSKFEIVSQQNKKRWKWSKKE